MSQEKTLPATSRQRERFAEQGEVARSRDLSGVAGLTAALLALVGLWPVLSARLLDATRRTLGSLDRIDLPATLAHTGATFALVALSMGTTVAVAAFAVGLLQSRGRIFWKSLKVDPSRLNPIPKLQQTYGSLEGLINLGLQVVKITLMSASCGALLYQAIPALITNVSVSEGPGPIVATLLPLALTGIATFLLIGIVDYLVSWFRLEKKMRMTHQEVRDDQKQSDGDPQMKSKRRSRAVELVRQRSLRAVPTSDVIVVNPTHFSVALKYDASLMVAPRVVAKGTDAVAMRIREIAADAGVPIVSEPPLARFLHRHVKVGRSVPGEAFQAVAKVLAFVYQRKRRAEA